MIRIASRTATTVLSIAVAYNLARGQAPPPTILTIDVANYVEYQGDIYDPLTFAKNPNITPPAQMPANFPVVTILGDIVAINGKPAKGMFAGRTRAIGARPDPRPGSAIADVARVAIREQIFEILQPDGTPIGTIVALGFSGGTPPPGAPVTQRGGNWAIVGGTGAFLGARGQMGGTGKQSGGRTASMAEDPANRRINGGGTFQFVLHIIPMTRPEIVITASGPAVTHSSAFTLVSAAKPAAAGEILSLFATGLGPVRPGVDPGQPFPSNPLAEVNSPVEVTVNGKRAEVLAAVGFPGTVDGYQLNFRMPSDAGRGAAAIQVVAAWIAGAPVSIMVQ